MPYAPTERYDALPLFLGMSRLGAGLGEGLDKAREEAKAFKGLIQYAEGSGLMSKDEAMVLGKEGTEGKLKGIIFAQEMKQREADRARAALLQNADEQRRAESHLLNMSRLRADTQRDLATAAQTLAEAEAARQPVTPQVVPLQGTGYGMAFAGNKPMGTVPMMQQPERVPDGYILINGKMERDPSRWEEVRVGDPYSPDGVRIQNRLREAVNRVGGEAPAGAFEAPPMGMLPTPARAPSKTVGPRLQMVTGPADGSADQVLQQAQAAIDAGKNPRAVMKRLSENGYNVRLSY